VNHAPVVGDVYNTIGENTQLTFTAADFTNRFSDVDGNNMTKIRITSLPANGLLKLSGVGVAANDEIATTNLGNLTFTPTAGWNGMTSFGWNGNDGTVYAAVGAVVYITVVPANNVPVAINDVVTTNEDTPIMNGKCGRQRQSK